MLSRFRPYFRYLKSNRDTLVAAIFGLFSYLAMPREAQPDIDVPYISVVVPFPAGGAVDYQTLFLVPTGMALAAVLLLALSFRPPTRAPETVTAL